MAPTRPPSSRGGAPVISPRIWCPGPTAGHTARAGSARFAGYTERVRRAVADQPYPRLIEQLERRPWWTRSTTRSPTRPSTSLSFFIHHEDVRRGLPAGSRGNCPTAQQARSGDPRRCWPGSTASVPAALRDRRRRPGEVTTGAGGEPLRLVGTPGELVMFLSGRQRAARVELDGAPAVAERLRTMPLPLDRLAPLVLSPSPVTVRPGGARARVLLSSRSSDDGRREAPG